VGGIVSSWFGFAIAAHYTPAPSGSGRQEKAAGQRRQLTMLVELGDAQEKKDKG
jgi:hypothetical protein